MELFFIFDLVGDTQRQVTKFFLRVDGYSFTVNPQIFDALKELGEINLT